MYVHAVFFRISVRYSSLSFLGVSSTWLCPAFARHIIRTPWSISCEEGRWDPKKRLLVEPPKGRWFCLKRTSRSLFGGWERGKLETPSFLWMDCFSFGIGSTCFAYSLFTRSGNPFFRIPCFVFIEVGPQDSRFDFLTSSRWSKAESRSFSSIAFL